MTTETEKTERIDLPTGTVTFMFTDIEGSTRLSQELGDGFAAVVDRHHAILRSAIISADGVVVSTEGDAFFAVFRDAVAAVRAASCIQRDLATERWPQDCAVRVRIGLHTGAGRLGGDDYAGVDVNRASRISSAGHGGQVLVSRATATPLADALPEDLSLRDLGAILLKDFDQAETVLQLDVPGVPHEFPPLRAQRPGWLPEPLTTFLGRDAEIDAVGALVGRSRLVTLTGPGGTGKTRLTIEVARGLQPRFPGGTWFVPLESIREPSLVLPQIVERMGLVAEPGQSMVELIAANAGGRPTLLVLDNLEQVIEVGPELGGLLARAVDVCILASSREPLRIAGEQEYPVPVLDESLAVELFIERARQVRPDLQPSDDELPQLRTLVARLDRLPLAIELAAARARRIPLTILCDMVIEGLADLDSGRRDAAERQRTIRGAVAWSYDLLDDDERRTFDRLAVFAGRADMTLAAEVIDPDARSTAASLALMESLADKSLLNIEEGPDGRPRLRMLETIRAYADERLAQDPDRERLEERHALVYLESCEAIEPELTGERSDVALARMELDHDDIRRALDWALVHRPAVGLRIGAAIWRFWQQRSHLEEGQRRLQALSDAATDADGPCALGRGCTALGGMYYWQGDNEQALRVYERAADYYRACGDPGAVAGALYDLSYPVAILGDVERAAELNEESLRLFESIEDDTGVALVKSGQAVLAVMQHDFEQARALQVDVVAIRRAEGGLFQIADNAGMLAIIEAHLGHIEEARELLEEVRAVNRRLRDRSGLVGGLLMRALIANGEADYETTALCAGAIQGMRDGGKRFLVPSEVMGIEDPAIEAREHLGERYEQIFGIGRGMAPEEVFLEDDLGVVPDDRSGTRAG